VADVGSRRIVGFALANRMPDELVVEVALDTRGSLAGAVLHTDRASQYLSRKYGACSRPSGCASRLAGWLPATTTWWPSRSSRPCKRELVHNQRFGGLGHGVRSMPGSTAPTPCACTRRSATCRPSATSFATLGRAWQPRTSDCQANGGKAIVQVVPVREGLASGMSCGGGHSGSDVAAALRDPVTPLVTTPVQP